MNIELPPSEVEPAPAQPIKSGRNWKKIALITVLATAGLALLAAAGAYWWYQDQLKPLSGSDEPVTVTIDAGTNAEQIGTILEEQSVIKSSTAFSIYVRRAGVRGQLRAGTYELRPNLSTPEVAEYLVEGRTAVQQLTIIPGQRLTVLEGQPPLPTTERLAELGYSQQQIDQALDPASYQLELVEGLDSLEGYLLPETYQTGLGQPATSLVGLALRTMDQALTADIRAGFAEQGLSVHQGLTLASIVQAEAGADSDYDKIAQVFLSRLEQDITLGADATFRYASDIAGVEHRIDIDSPYNTRLPGNTGLPPGPIGASSLQAIAAVANPADTDYLYFVAGDDGITRFSRTLEEHIKLVEETCKVNCQVTF